LRTLAQLGAAAVAALLLVSPAVAGGARSDRVEVVVTLEAPGLARAVKESKVLSARARAARLDLRSPMSTAYLADLGRAQRTLARRIVSAIPSAQVRWRYQVVLNGLAVVVPRDRLPQLGRIPGVARVDNESVAIRPALDRSPELIGADQLWGLPSFSTAGNGVKIGILDLGIDQHHPFFDPTGYAYPPGFPKGNAAYTSPKVIVARAFAPATTKWRYANLPYDPVNSDHGDHVAGIAGGDYTVGAVNGVGPLAGVAPRAYLGNYKIFAQPFPGEGLIENSAELIAGIEAAVRDGMDVINMSLGEIERDPSRSPLDDAINAAAAAGVVPVAAAGNSFAEYGRGSADAPGSAAAAISVAAATKSGVIALYSGSGPTSLSLRLKPDVTAPGDSILSALPVREGTWGSLSGTSMAAPHVAGAAALLRERHPSWSVAQIKSALVLTGDPVYTDANRTEEVPTTREGGGMINLPRADNPLLFASPTALSFGLVRVGTNASRSIRLTDAGGGGGPWSVSVRLQTQPTGVTVTAPTTAEVPGTLPVAAASAAGAAEADVTGFVVLSRGTDVRRIPFWLRTESPKLGAPSRTLPGPGLYKGNARLGQARVSSYRYPDAPEGSGLPSRLPGPEQVFRVRIGARAANFGVRVVSQGPGVRVSPRIVAAGDENRLLGSRALPLDVNPYLETYGDPASSAGAVAPRPGFYDIVFDTLSAATAGPFTFRLWVDDSAPPTAQLLTRTSRANGTLAVAVTDAGSGVDPESVKATIDGSSAVVSYGSGRANVSLGSRVGPGRHTLVLQVSDYQEEKNSESVLGVLPNTRTFRAAFTVS
jgi:subtilisin family serine protease